MEAFAAPRTAPAAMKLPLSVLSAFSAFWKPDPSKSSPTVAMSSRTFTLFALLLLHRLLLYLRHPVEHLVRFEQIGQGPFVLHFLQAPELFEHRAPDEPIDAVRGRVFYLLPANPSKSLEKEPYWVSRKKRTTVRLNRAWMADPSARPISPR